MTNALFDTPLLPRVATLDDLPADGTFALWEEGEILARRVEDDRYVGVRPLMFTWAVVAGSTHERLVCNPALRWCYSGAPAATAAAAVWDGAPGTEPIGWHRHPASGRRRPDGDPALEHVAP